MKAKAIIYVDVDEAEQPRYHYREPHFAIARQRGLICITLATRGHPYKDRLATASDEVILANDLRERTLLNLIVQIQNRYEVSAVFCYAGQATEEGQIGITVGNICRSLKLRHPSRTGIDACNDKYLMRQRLEQFGVPTVPAVLCHSADEVIAGAHAIGYPLIAKPRFGARSAFIKKCHNDSELLDHYGTYQREYQKALLGDSLGKRVEGGVSKNIPGSTLLLESWIEGIEGSVECVITEDRVHPLIINEKLIMTTRENTILENLLITPPESFSQDQQHIIRNYAIQCVRATGLTNAIAHFEFKMTSAGPLAIEINPRMGGLYVNSAFTDVAGLDPWELYLDVLLGDERLSNRLREAAQTIALCSERYAMMVIYPHRTGAFMGFECLKMLEESQAFLEFDQAPIGCRVRDDVEEHYLLKCWVSVENGRGAKALFKRLTAHAKPIILGGASQ